MLKKFIWNKKVHINEWWEDRGENMFHKQDSRVEMMKWKLEF